MDIRWLQDFLAVAETGNFTRAAESRNVSQAAFSRRIQSLESWLGVALIDRSVFPTRLTAEGEQFRQHAGDILRQMIDARRDLADRSVHDREHIRVALPFVLATSRLPQWWQGWTRQRSLAATVELGNIHDLVTALTAGNADLMFCYLSDQQPVQLDGGRYDRLVVERDILRPYASPALLAQGVALPGSAGCPVPLLMYSLGVYFARLVDLIVETTGQRLVGTRVMESDMADVLRDMALAGHGVAWLPDSTVMAGPEGLVALGGDVWTLPIEVVAFKDRANKRPSVTGLWSDLAHRASVPSPRPGDRRADRSPFVTQETSSMASIAYLNGHYLPLEEACVPVLDRGFLFADGIYEVSAVLDGRLVDNAAHLARFERSLGEIALAPPVSMAEIETIETELVRRNALTEGVVYMQVTRGVAPRDFAFPKDAQPTLLMFTQAKNIVQSPNVRTGIGVKTLDDIRWARRDIKSIALLAQVLAKQAAVEAGCQEAWMVEDGYVTEGGSSTAFIITKGDVLVTRPNSHALLPGCTRKAVLALAKEKGIRLEERPFTVAEALAGREAFITSASSFVQPVVKIDGRPVGNGVPGPATLRLREIYIEFARQSH